MDLSNVYFVTGTAYAGKSTVVKALAEKYNGVACRENYHEELMEGLDEKEFPYLAYTKNLKDWHDFIRRSPEEYETWVKGVSLECEKLELQLLDQISEQGKPVFVDTNISLETLRKITDARHVLIMIADPEVSVNRFFDRPDSEKQFLYQLMLEEPDPEKALENFRHCLERVNSADRYYDYLHSGFAVVARDEERPPERTLQLAEIAFGLEG